MMANLIWLSFSSTTGTEPDGQPYSSGGSIGIANNPIENHEVRRGRIVYLVRQLYGNYHWKDEAALKPAQCDAYWSALGQRPPIERRTMTPAHQQRRITPKNRQKPRKTHQKSRTKRGTPPGPAMTSSDGAKTFYLVESILDKSWERGEEFYLVKWAGFDDPKDNTWEPKDHFRPEVLEMFERQIKARNAGLI